MTTTFILIRHGETTWNQEGKLMGVTDIPLTAEGKRQAGKLAEHLRSYPLDVVFSSPLTRALQTAHAIYRFHKHIPFTVHKNLRERGFGSIEGMSYEEVNARHPELVYTETWKYLHFHPKNGESLFDIQRRANYMLSVILPRYLGKNIAIVSHGTFLRILTGQILQIPLTQLAQFRMNNGAFTLLQLSQNQDPMLQIVNYTEHLEDTIDV